MKKSFFYVVILVLFMFGCASKVTDFSDLQDRNGLFFQINSDKPFTGKVVNKTNNDVIEFEGAFKEGLRVGTWTFYYPNRQIQTTGVYLDGLKDGQWPVWKENGEVDYYEVFKFGNLIAGGPTTESVADGEVEENEGTDDIEVVEDKKNEVRFVDWVQLRGGSRKSLDGAPYTGGVIKYFKGTRNRELVGYYTNGYRSGKWTYYNKNGSVKDVRYY